MVLSEELLELCSLVCVQASNSNVADLQLWPMFLSIVAGIVLHSGVRSVSLPLDDHRNFDEATWLPANWAPRYMQEFSLPLRAFADLAYCPIVSLLQHRILWGFSFAVFYLLA
jgi:hypothetical protein